MSRVLVVYYSRSGHTRTIAEALARSEGWDLDAVGDIHPRAGVLGWVRSMYEATVERCPAIKPVRHDPARYELVVIGTPVWNASLASPMRTYLNEYGGRIARPAFFLTFGGRGSESTFAQMAALVSGPPLVTLAVKARELDENRFAARLAAFTRAIDHALEPAPGAMETAPLLH